MCVYMSACVCLHRSVYICAHISSSVLEYVKIYCSSGTFDKHSNLSIFDKHLVCQINQGLPKILLQHPLEIALAVWQLKKNSTNCQIKITNSQVHILYLHNTHAFQKFKLGNIYLHFTIHIASLLFWTMYAQN